MNEPMLSAGLRPSFLAARPAPLPISDADLATVIALAAAGRRIPDLVLDAIGRRFALCEARRERCPPSR